MAILIYKIVHHQSCVNAQYFKAPRYRQLIYLKKLYEQKCTCSILWSKRLPALP